MKLSLEALQANLKKYTDKSTPLIEIGSDFLSSDQNYSYVIQINELAQ